MDPIQDVAGRLAPMANEKAEQTVKVRRAIRTALTILSTRPGPTGRHIQSSHPGR
jgi:hypothetical protein